MKCKAIGNIRRDGRTYAPGDEIELTDAEAAPLLKSGLIEPIIKPFSKPVQKTALHSASQER